MCIHQSIFQNSKKECLSTKAKTHIHHRSSPNTQSLTKKISPPNFLERERYSLFQLPFSIMHCFRRAALRASIPRSSNLLSRKNHTNSFLVHQNRTASAYKSSSLSFGRIRLYSTESEAKETAGVQDHDEAVAVDPSESAEGSAGRSILSEEEKNEASANQSFTESATSVASGVLNSARDTASSAAESVSSAFGNNEFTRLDIKPNETIYVGNLYFGVDTKQLEDVFGQYGEIVASDTIKDQRGLNKGFGYLTFTTLESAQKAVDEMNQKQLEGRRMVVNFARKKKPLAKVQSTEPVNPPTKTLFVGNLSWEMTDQDLHDLFRPIHNVLDVRVAVDRRTSQPRGFAHADFLDVESAMKAAELLKGKEIYGRTLRIDYALNRVRQTNSD